MTTHEMDNMVLIILICLIFIVPFPVMLISEIIYDYKEAKAKRLTTPVRLSPSPEEWITKEEQQWQQYKREKFVLLKGGKQ